MKKILSLIAILAIAGCAGIVTMDYKPSSLLSGDGDIRLGRFDYSPQGKVKVESNQVQDTLFIPIYLDQPVADYVRKAFALELKFAGYNTGSPESIVMYANVRKLESDSLSVGIDWTLEIDYTFVHHGEAVYGRSIITKVHSSKVNMPFEGINKVIRMSFEKIMTDPVVKKLLKYSPGDIRMMIEEQKREENAG